MSLPPGATDGGEVGKPAALAPKPGGMPKEGSRDVHDGQIICVPWDWCKSPTSPVPYKIWAWQSDSAALATTVRQTSDRSHVSGSIVRECFGDEAGTGGGVVSGTHNAECTPKTWSATVRFEGRNAVRHDDEWWMNHKNTWGKLQYTKDMSTSSPPEVPLIKASMPGLSATDAFVASSQGQGTQVASAGAVAAPAAGGGGFGEMAGQMGEAVVNAGKYVAGAAEELGLGAAAGTAALAGGFLLLMTSSTAKDDTIVRVTRTEVEKKCPPCVTIGGRHVPVGTIGYRLDLVPPSRPHYPQPGDHYNLSVAQQNPNNCRCFWKPMKHAADARNGLPPPPGSIPIEDFV